MQKNSPDTLQSENKKEWYLRILDKSVFGPVDRETLCSWANQARIIPGHHISSDQQNWIAVETIEDFRMNWQVAMNNGDIYGPLNISVLKNLLQDEIIDATASVTNLITGKTATIIDQMFDQINENYELHIKFEEADAKYQKILTEHNNLLCELEHEKEIRIKAEAEQTRIKEELKEQTTQEEKEKHAVDVIEVYPEAILINNGSSLAKRNMCTQETLEQLEAQAVNDLTTWHKLYKKSAKQKRNRFLPLQLFKAKQY